MNYCPPTLTELEIQTYIVNLKRRKDRRRRMFEILPDCLMAEFTSDWDIETDWKEIDWANLSGINLFPWKISSTNNWWNRPMLKGEVACAIAHFTCWNAAAVSGKDPCLFLEDDITFVEGFSENLESSLTGLKSDNLNWDLLYLGREPLRSDTIIKQGIVAPGYSFGAYAYMLSQAGIRELLTAGYMEHLIPVDEFLPSMYTDHPREDVRRVFRKRLLAYALQPPLVPEVDDVRWGSDTETSEAF